MLSPPQSSLHANLSWSTLQAISQLPDFFKEIFGKWTNSTNIPCDLSLRGLSAWRFMVLKAAHHQARWKDRLPWGRWTGWPLRAPSFTSRGFCGDSRVAGSVRGGGQTLQLCRCIRGCWGGFPGGSVVKNLPANAKDMSSIPNLQRSHMPGGN